MSSSPRILVVHPYEDLDANLTMSLFLETLARLEVNTDVFFPSWHRRLVLKPFGKTVTLWPIHPAFFEQTPPKTPSLTRLLVRYLRRAMMTWTLRRPYPFRLEHAIFSRLAAKKYAVFIGSDPHGIALADHMNQRTRRPLVYLSFEILCQEAILWDEEKEMKRLELPACQRVSLALIQDEERAELLHRETSIPRDKMALVPVAPPPLEVKKSDYLRKKLGIGPEMRIVLNCGNLWAWNSREMLDEMVSYWPENYCLVIHLPSVPDHRLKCFLRRLANNNKKILISAEPLPRLELPQLVASADFGLAPYIPTPEWWQTGENQYHIGFGSSKVAIYSACGLPILARSLPVFEREFATYRCGKIYRRLAETGDLLVAMDQDYEFHRAESLRFYRERLNPVKPMEEFCKQLMALAGFPTTS
jgi:hypothetical protein